MTWCQWQLVRTRMMVSKRLKSGANRLKIQNSKTLVRMKFFLSKNCKSILITVFNKSICL